MRVISSATSRTRFPRGFLCHCSRRQLFAKCRHSGLPRCRVAVRSANCSCPLRVAKTFAPQSTPFARQVAASRAPLLRMRFLWTDYLSVRHDFWPRPLSVDTHPTVTTCEANTERTLRFLRFTEPCDKCGVGPMAMTHPDSAAWQVLTRHVAVAGQGTFAIRALPDVCLGIRSERRGLSRRHPQFLARASRSCAGGRYY
jgi:hypothetical protein